MTSCARWTVLLTETENLFPDRRALDSEELQCGDELGGDSHSVFCGMELDLVLGLRIVKVHLQRYGPPVCLNQRDEILAELFCEHRSGDADGKCVQHRLVDVTQKHYLLHSESVR